MAAADEQDLLTFLADLGDGDDPVDAEDPDDAEEATPNTLHAASTTCFA